MGSFDAGDMDLSRLAVQELLRDAQRASDRAASFGATAWQRSPVPRTNRTFLNRALAGALTQNAWLASKTTKTSRATASHPPTPEMLMDTLRIDETSEPSCSSGQGPFRDTSTDQGPFRRPSDVAGKSPRKSHDAKWSPMKSPKRCGEKFSPRREGSCGKRERSLEGRKGAEGPGRKRTCSRH